MSIRVSTGGFSFSSASGQQSHAVREGELLPALREALRRNQALDAGEGAVELLCNGLATFVPLNEFRSEEALAIFRTTFGSDCVPQGCCVRYEVLSELELVVLYLVDTAVEQVVEEFLPQAVTRSYAGKLLLRGQEVDRLMPLGKRRMHASVQDNILLLFTYVDNRLHYCNSFPAAELNTQVYYTLYVWQHMELTQERDILVVHGAGEDYISELRKFILEISCV